MTRLALLLCLWTLGCASKPSRPKADSATQSERLALIEKFVAAGHVTKHESAPRPTSLPRIWVGASFHAADIDDKNAMLGVFAAYYAELPKGSEWERGEVYLTVLDGKTGREIGQFDWRGYQAD